MKVFVTGGAGYVGSFAVRALKDSGADVVVFDNLEGGHREIMTELGVELLEGDLRNERDIAEALDSSFDAVMHFAAYACVGESTKNPPRYFRNNVVATINLLDALLRAEIKKLVFSSSSEVYAEAEKLPLTEDMPLGSENPYGLSKLMIEQIVPWYEAYGGIKFVSLRYFNAAGASLDGLMGEDHDPETHLIPNAIRGALGLCDFALTCSTSLDTPDGSPIRDYTHVLDLADAHVRALDYLVSGGESGAFNVGKGCGSSVLEVIKAVKEITGADFAVGEGRARVGEPLAKWASTKKINEVLGWEAKYDLKDIVESACKWHKSHPQGYASHRLSRG